MGSFIARRAQAGNSDRCGGAGWRGGLLARSVAGAGACALMIPAAAKAQSDSYFDRTHNVGVLDRPRPDYASLGVQVGSFTLFPTLTLSPEFDSNIFAADKGPTSDAIVVVAPSVTAQSNWSRNAVNLAFSDTDNIFTSHSEESTNNYSVSGGGRLDILSASNLNANASYSENTIARTAENNITTAQAPVQYSLGSISAGALQGLSRFKFSENFNFTKTSYENAFSDSGQSLNLNLSDNDQYIGAARADYGLTPEISFFVSGTYNWRVYPSSTLVVDRSSQGFETTVGADFDITSLIRGQVQIGYLQQTYQSALFHTVSGPAVHLQAEYFLSGLTTITARVDRNVIDAVDPTAISFLDTQASLRIDHEFLRNLLVSGQVGFEDADFKGIPRDDHRPTATASATYLLNRYMGLTLAYSFLNEASSGLDRIQDYTVNLVTLSLVLRL